MASGFRGTVLFAEAKNLESLRLDVFVGFAVTTISKRHIFKTFGQLQEASGKSALVAVPAPEDILLQLPQKLWALASKDNVISQRQHPPKTSLAESDSSSHNREQAILEFLLKHYTGELPALSSA